MVSGQGSVTTGHRPPATGHYSFYKKTGCDECLGTGYLGRKGIYELLEVDDDIRRVILQGSDSSSIRAVADKKGMKGMKADGADKIMQGITSVEEVLRVTQEE